MEKPRTPLSPKDSLQLLTKEANASVLSTSEAYVQFAESLDGMPEYYFSTTITSGGFAREGSGVSAPKEVIARNTNAARELSVAIATDYDLSESQYILPTDLGYVGHWSQADYLMFWMHALHGMPQDQSQKIELLEREVRRLAAQSIKLIESGSGSPDEKWAAYARLVMMYLEQSMQHDELIRGSNPIKSAVFLVDTEESLGCRAEKLFADGMGINTYELAEGRSMPSAKLRRELGQLGAVGAKVSSPHKTFHLVGR